VTFPHLCHCADGVTVVCLCDNTKDHDESGFTVSEGVHLVEEDDVVLEWIAELPEEDDL
jgi:hypothetical protein